jgi:hypothetical protein
VDAVRFAKAITRNGLGEPWGNELADPVSQETVAPPKVCPACRSKALTTTSKTVTAEQLSL